MKRKALLSSILTIVLCVSIIAGSTFALFTSQTELNIAVTAGEVDVLANFKDLTLYSVVPDEVNGTEVDEFGALYRYEQQSEKFLNSGTATINGSVLTLERITPGDKVSFKVNVDNGSNVAIAHRLSLSCLGGYGLMYGLKVTIGGTTYESLESYVGGWSSLAANGAINDVEVVIELPVSAGNEYQKLSTSINILVEAVQSNASVEIGGQPEVTYIETVDDADALATAIAAGGNIVLGADVTLPTDVITIANDTVIELLGNDLDASACGRRPFELTNGADLTIIANETSTVKVGNYGLVYIPDGESDVTLIGGNYVGNTDRGAFIKPKGDDLINITLTDVNYSDSSEKNWLIDGASYTGSDLSITIEGGKFDVTTGVATHAGEVSIKNATFNVGILALEAGLDSNAIVENCTINVKADGVYNAAAPNTCIAASNGGKAVVNNCVLTSDTHVFALYSGATSAIEANGCTITHSSTVYDANVVFQNSVVGDADINNITVNP